MSSLIHKRIVVGVTGGIAAYKSAELVRQLRQRGAEVRVVMTQGAQAFITPLTLQTLSAHPVYEHLLDPQAEATMGHIDLARWADVIVIAPATANIIAELAGGQTTQLLTALCLAASQVPLMMAPAMNQQMWQNVSTQQNIGQLRQCGWQIIGPASGEQACGEVGPGRMVEPAEIAQAVADLFATGKLAGCRILLTAGPTIEAIDPVRFLSNHSSGKMGYALAQAAVEAGARVTLISGPVSLTAPEQVDKITVVSAEQMLTAVLAQVAQHDLFISCAAVADYRPAVSAQQKLKKSAASLTLELIPNPDIVATIAALPDKPIVIGFAAQTEQVVVNARQKLYAKGLDAIIANLVGPPDQGFTADDNALTLISQTAEVSLPLASKTKGARQIIDWLAEQFWRIEQDETS